MHFVLHIFVFKYCIPQNQATEYASQHIWCLSQGRINWEGCGRKVIRCKNAGEKGGSLISPDGVAPSQIVGVSASVIFPCTIKSRRFLLAPAHSGSPRKRAVTWLRVCIPQNRRVITAKCYYCSLCNLTIIITVAISNRGDGGGGYWLFRMEWHPARWSVCLPLLIFPCTMKSRSSLLAPAHTGGPEKGP